MIHPLRLQQLHTSADGTLHHQQIQSLPPGLQSLDAISPEPNDGIFQRYLGDASQAQHHQLHAPNPFEHNAGLPHSQAQFQVPPNGYQHPTTLRFNPLQAPPQHIQAPPPPPPQPTQLSQAPSQLIPRISELEQQEFVQTQTQTQETEDTPVTNHGQFEGLKLIPNPPDLEEWREKLFHVDDTITLTEDE
jgi:hypothetical protein